MLITNLKPLFLAAAVAAFVGATVEARAAVLIVDGFGQLTGAEDVDVNGTLYDVTFADGSCVGLFGGCDDDSDFTFNVQADALAAAQALLDQVFINDLALGQFDADPSLTNGCSGPGDCTAFIPFTLDGNARSAVARNNPGGGADLFGTGAVGVGIDLAVSVGSTFALFAEASPDSSSNDVPAPAALWLLGFGLAGLGFANRKARPTAS